MFYTKLDSVLDQCPRRDTLIVLGDFNVVTGTERAGYKLCVGPHGSGTTNINSCSPECYKIQKVKNHRFFVTETRLNCCSEGICNKYFVSYSCHYSRTTHVNGQSWWIQRYIFIAEHILALEKYDISCLKRNFFIRVSCYTTIEFFLYNEPFLAHMWWYTRNTVISLDMYVH